MPVVLSLHWFTYNDITRHARGVVIARVHIQRYYKTRPWCSHCTCSHI